MPADTELAGAEAEAGMKPYETEPGPMGGLRRYGVLLRVTRNLDTCPSGDEFTTHTVWAYDPYHASSVATILSKRLCGLLTRRLVGVEEWPLIAATRPQP